MSKLIITSDWHLREKPPISRRGAFWDEMWVKVNFVADLQRKLKCPVLHAGDLFDYWKPSPRLLSYTINAIPDKFKTIYGNHDLPRHSFELRDMTGIYTLEQAGVLEVLHSGHWEREVTEDDVLNFDGLRVLVLHKFVYKPGGTAQTWEREIGTNAGRLLRKYKDIADLIITGDNHQSFVVKLFDRVLINPGSLLRLTIGQKDFQPKVYVVDTETLEVEPILLPIKQDVWVDDIRQAEVNKTQVEAFISGLKQDFDVGIDFKTNLRRFFELNKTPKDIQEVIWGTF